jgi:hypothetical protein
MSSKKTLIAISAAMALGIAGASVARANDSGENHQDNDRSAVSRSVAQVNHPAWFGNSANAGGAYGYAAAPIHKQRPVRGQTESR